MGDRANGVALGDDAAVAGGLVGHAHARSNTDSTPVFVGDAIADPLSGLEATLAVLEALGRGGGEIVEIALAEVAASYATLPLATAARKIDEPPQVPAPTRRASELGADNQRVCELIEARLATC